MIVELFKGFLIVMGLLIAGEVIYRLCDWIVFRANNLAGEMDEEE
tara:strand:- start:128 stop:262 length:135 start_codon:yes stop_codon:yes gene_type:complete